MRRKVIAADANQIEPESARKRKLASGPRPGSSPWQVRKPISTDPAVPRKKLSTTPAGPACSPATSTAAATHFSRISPACIAPSPANLPLPWATPASTLFTASMAISAATSRSRPAEAAGTGRGPASWAARNTAASTSPRPRLAIRAVRNSGFAAWWSPWVFATRMASAHGRPALSSPAASSSTFWTALTTPNRAGTRSQASPRPKA